MSDLYSSAQTFIVQEIFMAPLGTLVILETMKNIQKIGSALV